MTKTDFDSKLSNLNRKIAKNKADHLLIQNKFKKLQTFDLSCFIGKNYFKEDGAQDILKHFQILVMFYHRNLKDYLLKLLSYILHHHLLHLIIIFYQH